MNKQKVFQITAAALVVVLTLLAPGTWTAAARAPSNDDFKKATVINSLPFQDSIDTRGATVAADDPYPNCFYQRAATVWYKFTPVQDMVIDASTAGSNYGTTISVFTGVRGSLNQIACTSYSSIIRLAISANVSYHFMISATNAGPYPYPPPGGSGGLLKFSVSQVLPPPNDNFGNAIVIPGLPFNNHQDTSGATLEANERIPSCASYYYSPGKTIWYAYTPITSGSVTANNNVSFSQFMAAYTGNALNNLTEIACRTYWGPLTFHAEAGVTVYFQLGSLYGDSGSLDFSLDVTPPPTASFNYYPYDPSIYDTIQFYDSSYDPGYIGFQSYTWDFGDGSTATGYSANHRFVADGDYNVSHTVTTYDGRTGAVSSVVSVRTHDVAITKFTVPQSAKVGQTRQITVSIRNSNYPENVTVEFYVSTPYGYNLVGTLTQYVPVRPSNRTTDFNFSYTFTNDDGKTGKVTFKAIAKINGGRDALPADNEAISLPTKVTGYKPGPYGASIVSPSGTVSAVSTFGLLGVGLAFGFYLVGGWPKKWHAQRRRSE